MKAESSEVSAGPSVVDGCSGTHADGLRQSQMNGLAHGFGAVIGRKNKYRILVLAQTFQMRDQPPDMVIHRLDHGPINRHAFGLVSLLHRR